MKINSVNHGLTLALAQAVQSPYKTHKLGAVLCDKHGRVLATGYNQRKSHPFQAKASLLAGEPRKIFLHAEVAAIVTAIRERTINKAVTIYVARLTKAGNVGLAKPCNTCAGLLGELGITYIYTKEGVLTHGMGSDIL